MSAQTHTAARAQKLLRRKGALTPLILVMGFIGASLRYLLECSLPANGGFPAATLVINIFGCFVLELVNQYVGRRMHLPGALVKSLGVGLVGAFTQYRRSQPSASLFCRQARSACGQPIS